MATMSSEVARLNGSEGVRRRKSVGNRARHWQRRQRRRRRLSDTPPSQRTDLAGVASIYIVYTHLSIACIPRSSAFSTPLCVVTLSISFCHRHRSDPQHDHKPIEDAPPRPSLARDQSWLPVHPVSQVSTGSLPSVSREVSQLM
jgi:hypothetical protein